MTMTEQAITEILGPRPGPPMNMFGLVGRLAKALRLRRKGIQLHPNDLARLVAIAQASKDVIALDIPTGLLLTPSWLRFIAACDAVSFAKPGHMEKPADGKEDCGHFRIYHDDGDHVWRCDGCTATATDREVFELQTERQDLDVPNAAGWVMDHEQ